jgi:hypothetical protein
MAEKPDHPDPHPAARKGRPAETPTRVIGYCTNVHAGVTLEEVKRNLETHAVAVRERLQQAGVIADGDALGIGLWLPARAARELRESNGTHALREWLEERRLHVFTINGFPHGDFHRQIVKHRVYHPRWSDLARLNYTRDLIHILADLLPEGGEGSISTLPIGWAGDVSPRDQHSAAALLHDAVKVMADIEHWQHKLIHLDIEPEPGCLLQKSEDVVAFFRKHLFSHPQSKLARRHLRICHDICHAAVMFEDQRDVIRMYDSIGAAIGKVQVSSAMRVNFDELDPADREQAFEQLGRFREDRYLHQTLVRMSDGKPPRFFDDLPEAMAESKPVGEWRVHFHVPIFLEQLDLLGTTRDDIPRCLKLLHGRDEVHHFEVETYAWNVLPRSVDVEDLADGIAREMSWLREQLDRPLSLRELTMD